MYFLIAFACLLLLFFLSSAKIILSVHRIYEDDNIQVKIMMLFGLIKLNFKVPYVDIIFNKRKIPAADVMTEGGTKQRGLFKEKSSFSIDEIKNTLNKIGELNKKYYKVFKYLISKLNVDSIKWYTQIGLEDAALTAISTGALYTIKSNIINFIYDKVNHDSVDIKVNPNYTKYIFEVDLHCIIRIKIANIIIAGTKILYIFVLSKVYKKGGELDERASYPGTDENYNG